MYAASIDRSTPDPLSLLAQVFVAPGGGDETTTRILDAAHEQFSLVGIRRTSMEDVARRAGVSRVTVYRHVATKDALVELVLRREFQGYVAEYVARLGEARSAQERIVGGYLTTLRAIRGNTLVQSLLSLELDSLVASMAGSAEQVLSLARMFVATQLRAEQAGGEIAASIDVDVVADLMVRLAVSFVLIPSDVVDLDDEAATEAMVRAFLLPLLGWTAS